MFNNQTQIASALQSGDEYDELCPSEIIKKCGHRCQLEHNSVVAKIDECKCGEEEFDNILKNECLFCKTPTASKPEAKGQCSKTACNLGCIKITDCQGGDGTCSFCVPYTGAPAETLNVSANGTCKQSACNAVCEKSSDCEGGTTAQSCKVCLKQVGQAYGRCHGTVTQFTAVRNAREYDSVSSTLTANIGMVNNSNCFKAIQMPMSTFTAQNKSQTVWKNSDGETLYTNRKGSTAGYAAYMGTCAGGYNRGGCLTSCDAVKGISSGLTQGEKETLCAVMKGLDGSQSGRYGRYLTSDYSTAVNSTSSIFLDSECNIVQVSAADLALLGIASVTMYTLSPISLVWDNKQQSVTIVQFPLGLVDNKKYVIWQASKSTPLLVFDPEKKGSITSGQQLLGQFAFGKKWQNGFEALASLDADGDEKVSGRELKPLSLWFDKNQNGISEEGEVVDLQEAGVTELYYEISGDNAVTGSIVANDGYVRVGKNKELIAGKLVDWYSAEFDNQLEAEKVLNAQKAELNDVDKVKTNPFSGVWAWSNKNNLTSEPDGIFIINNENGAITGLSIAEVKLEQNPKGIKSALIRTPFKNVVYSENGSKKELKFTLELEEGVKTNSTIELSSNGKALYGVSRSERLDKNGEKEFVNYSWSAKPLYE
ncbi:MAG: hypothetical protein LBE20_06510 [Deltaproteobacteria bacterium]|nr:hypothetical protein [Deltaproteobacteria bacterium]